MNVQNTKAIAQSLAMPVADVLEAARDLGVEMTYRYDNRYWMVSDLATAKALHAHLAN